MPMKTRSIDVTIASNKGTASFDINGIVTGVFVEPAGTATLSACNAGVFEAWLHPRTVKASAALNTNAITTLWVKDVDGSFTNTISRPLEVRFDTGTNGDEWVAHVDYLESWS